MIEVFVLRSIWGRIDYFAESKGLAARKWQIMAVIFWIFAEFTGTIIGYSFTANTLLSVLLFGYPAAYLSYYLIKRKILSYPDKEEDWIHTIGRTSA